MTVAQFQLSGQQSLDLIRCCADQPAEITTVSVISGDYTMEILETAFAAVTDRHDILRTGFEYREGLKLPLQTVYQPQGWNNNCFRTETLSLASPLSIKILQLPDRSFQVTIKAFPLILDAYSISLLYQELNTILTGQVFAISKDELLQFSDYTNWETQLIEEDNKNAAEFWSGSWQTDANLNSIWRVPVAETGYSDTKLILEDLPLEQYAASYNVSVKALLTAIFAQSIARYNAEEPLQVACLENGRSYEELKFTMGPLSRYYPVRFPAGFTGSISTWAELSGSQLAQATDWNDYYYAPANPLLEYPQVQFVLEYCDVTDDQDMEIVPSFNGTFLCRILRKKNTWQIILSYPSGMELAAFLLDDLQNRLQSPELPGLHVGIKDRIAIAEYNNTAMEFPGPDTVPHMILDCFKQYAGHIAVKGNQVSLTYQTLEEKVKGIAFVLSTVYSIGNGDTIGIMLNNDEDVAAVLLGILFSGAAYVPLDSSNPLQRLEHIVKDSCCRMIITDDSIPGEMTGSFVTIEKLEAIAAGYTSFPPLKMPAPEDTAYLIFTSGTTGNPKGCQISHANLNNYISWANDYYFHNCNGNFPLLTSLAFDLTVTSIFTTLTRGRTLYCLDKHLDVTEKLRYCFDPSNEIDCIKLTPTHISLLADAGLQNANIACAIVGGEELHPSQVDILKRLSPSIRIYNEYGPTEATVGCIVKEISPEDERITIGRPIANMNVTVLDTAGNILPVGVYGELYLTGSSVARGYWQQPVITAQRFVTLADQAALRYYRTGDIVRLLPGGDMEFGGRIDDQIKIRGNRIEMGEIKIHLSQFPGVEEVLVVARKDAKEEKHITAYYIAAQNIALQDWKSFLQSRVPAYMIPDFFIAITKIPATVNGKLDVEKLPDPFSMKYNFRKAYVSPVTPAEISISQLWQEILQVEKVGLDDNFYEMGGHSLLAMRAVSAIRREWKVDIIIKDLLTGPTVRELAALVDRLEKNSVLPQVVLVTERPEKIPLSYAQERLWFIDQLRGSIHYHMPTLFRLKGQLDVLLLEDAFRMIVDRHESLRTVFKVENGVPYQEILSAGGWRLNIVDNIPDDLHPDDLHAAITAEIDQPFELSADHMLRVRLFRLREDEHLLVLVRHHIASDGWSESLIVQEFCEVYQAGILNREPVLAVLPLQYTDYALWQRSHLTGDLLEQQLGYWEAKLKGVSPLQLPTDLRRPAVQSIQGDRLNFRVGKELSNRLQQLAQQEDVTPFMLLLSVYKVLLYRYSNQTDICIGTTVAHRPQQELEPLIGFFVNTLALRSDLSDNPEFGSLLSQVRTTTLEAYAHIAVPFEKVVDRVEKERDKSRSSLFQVLFVLNNNDSALVQDLGDITVTPESLDHKIAKFDLTFFVEETAEGFGISINYCTDLFLSSTIERMKDHYLQLLSSVADDQSQPVGHLQMLLLEEEAALLSKAVNPLFVSGEASGETSGEAETIVSLFKKQVVSTPEKLALIWGETQLSYQELDNSSTCLARYLQQTYDLKANNLIGVMMENSSWSVIAILGILKAGAAYVPIDPSLPTERQDYIINDTGIKVLLITSENLFEVLSFNIPVFSVDLQLEEQAASPLAEVSSTDLAYVIYTSGTTGHPKGVMITHGNITDYYKGLSAAVGLHELQSFGLMSSLSADLGNTVLFGSLLSGGTLHLFSKSQLMNALQLHDYFGSHVIDCIKIVPSHWNALEIEDRSLLPSRSIIFGGESLSSVMVAKILQQSPGLDIINHYGPTETTIGKLLHRIQKDVKYDIIPIGRIFSASEVYIVNAQQQLCPPGVSGELLIGGAGVSPGYLHQPELSAAKFIAHPFVREGGRLYRTGDLVRRLPSGEIIFLGRVDDQVKIRGYRVEPGEVSRVLLGCEGVHQCVVTTDSTDQPRLIAYVVMEGVFDQEVLQTYLRDRLPDYMQPSFYIPLPSLPLTSNGKIDRRSLPSPVTVTGKSDNYVAPRNEIEEQLAVIWAGLLNVERVGIYDNFFELGGHSLLAIRVLSALKKDAGIDVTITDLFEYLTIASLAEYLADRKEVYTLPLITVQKRPERIPLSYAQERLWFIDQLRGSTHYHMPTLFRLKGQLDVSLLEAAFRMIVDRHESLRTVFKVEDGVPYQEILSAGGWRLNIVDNIPDDLHPDNLHPDSLHAAITAEIDQPFDLSTDHMLRARLFRLQEGEHLLVLVRHHIASDGWSVSLIVQEFCEIYQNREPALPALPLQYADYALWQRSHLTGDLLEQQLGYWEEKLKGVTPLQLPSDLRRPAVQSIQGDRLNFRVDKELSNRLQQLAQQEDVTPFMLLLSVYKVLLYRYSNQTDICVGTTVAHRPQQELEPLIGFFVNTLALRSDLSDNPDFGSLLSQVRTTTLEAYAHIAVPFEKVVDRVEKERDKSRSSLFQVLFVLNNNDSALVQDLGDITVAQESLDHKIAKFDLTFFVEETAEGFGISINYCTDLFLPSTIERMKDHYLQLLSSVADDQSQPVGHLQMLLPEEEAALLSEAVNPLFVPGEVSGKVSGKISGEVAREASGEAETIVSLFRSQVISTPERVALISGATQLSYQELDNSSSCLAHYLQQTYDLQANDLVGVMMENSSWSVIAILGILKAGAAYVPIDPSLPTERQAYIINDTGIKVLLITSGSLFDVLSFNVPVFSVDLQLEELTTPLLLSEVSSTDLAYVIYTSGTTGHPKGVMITHGNITDYYKGLSAAVGLHELQSFGLMSSLSADLGNTVLFGALLSGGALYLFSKSQLMNALQLHDYFGSHVIDCIKIVPSHWNALEVEGRSLLPSRSIIFGGESLSSVMVAKILQQSPGLDIINHYGPTETTIGKLLHRIQRDIKYDIIPIGRIFSASEVYIVNAQQQLCPPGVSGELLIGGAGVSPGYLHQPELSAAKFIAHPFVRDGGRLYRTGDLVRRLPSGEIIFLGRVDDQVKIRGYRVEPGEVSRVLLGCEGVHQCVVTTDSTDQPRLIAYVVMEGVFDQEVLQTYLRDRLPDYMQPSFYIPLPSLPLTSNGKIDRRSLPSPATVTGKSDNYVAPRNEIEEQLAVIWAGLLNVERVGIYDNFFELGGDSIVVIQAVSRAKRKGLHLQVQDMFDYQTVAGLADMVRQNNISSLKAEQGLLTGNCELSPIQHWFFEQENSRLSYFNQSILLQLGKDVTSDELRIVLHEILLKHDALRFVYTKGVVWEQLYGNYEGKLEEVDLSVIAMEQLPGLITEECSRFQASLDIEKGELVRFVVIRTPESDADDRLFIAVHHLAIDGVSWRILIDDMQNRLDYLKENREADAGELKTSSYRDWINALIAFSNTERVTSQLTYWENVLGAFRPLPVDIKRNGVLRKSLTTVETTLDSELTEALLREINQVYNTEVNDLLLCALGMTVAAWSGSDRVHIGLESHGREDILPDIDITGTVGWFTNKFPVRLDIERHVSGGNLIKSVKEQLRSIPDKGIGYGCLRYLNNATSLRNNSWDIVFNYLGQLDNVVKSSRWFKGANEYSGDHISPEYPVRDRFVVKGIVTGNTLKIYWTFSTEQYYSSTVEKLAADYIAHLTALIRHCSNKGQKTITPSDFGLNGKIDYKELDALFGITETEDEDGIIKF